MQLKATLWSKVITLYRPKTTTYYIKSKLIHFLYNTSQNISSNSWCAKETQLQCATTPPRLEVLLAPFSFLNPYTYIQTILKIHKDEKKEVTNKKNRVKDLEVNVNQGVKD